jgi:hypothetical protein
MAPGRYTELFFLEEATAFAAGHRPCATCRRDRYLEFIRMWETVHGGPKDGRTVPQTVDWKLHKSRITRREKVTYQADCMLLPDGTIIAEGMEARLIWKGQGLLWSFDGYTQGSHLKPGLVDVLTPKPLVALMLQEYRPDIHGSHGAMS